MQASTENDVIDRVLITKTSEIQTLKTLIPMETSIVQIIIDRLLYCVILDEWQTSDKDRVVI